MALRQSTRGLGTSRAARCADNFDRASVYEPPVNPQRLPAAVLLHDTRRMGVRIRIRGHVALLAVAFDILGATCPCFAQDTSAVVESLFNEGKRLAAAGSYSEACPKFLASYNLEHRTGTLLNLADC